MVPSGKVGGFDSHAEDDVRVPSFLTSEVHKVSQQPTEFGDDSGSRSSEVMLDHTPS